MTFETVDVYVMKTLGSLDDWSYPKLPLRRSAGNVFVGSGNAFNVGSLFTKKYGGNAVSASSYQAYFDSCDPSDFTSVNIISASGGKDAVRMASFLKERGFKPNLLTCDQKPPASEFVPQESIFVYPSFTEPPTYNVSTYASMIHSLFHEDVGEIIRMLEGLEIPDLRKYKFVLFVSSDEHEPIATMAARKVGESLGGVGSHGEGLSTARHGMLLHPNKEWLDFCINCSTGTENTYRLDSGSFLGALMATYYIIGKNQRPEDVESIERNYAANAQKLGWKFNKVW